MGGRLREQRSQDDPLHPRPVTQQRQANRRTAGIGFRGRKFTPNASQPFDVQIQVVPVFPDSPKRLHEGFEYFPLGTVDGEGGGSVHTLQHAVCGVLQKLKGEDDRRAGLVLHGINAAAFPDLVVIHFPEQCVCSAT